MYKHDPTTYHPFRPEKNLHKHEKKKKKNRVYRAVLTTYVGATKKALAKPIPCAR